jgi:hypothetical protein
MARHRSARPLLGGARRLGRAPRALGAIPPARVGGGLKVGGGRPTQQTTASAQEIASSAQELARTAEDLERLVSRFKV